MCNVVLSERSNYLELDIMLQDIKIGEAEIRTDKNELSRFQIYDEYQNRGYGTEALMGLVNKYYIDNLCVKADNNRAKHVYEKVGFNITTTEYFKMEK